MLLPSLDDATTPGGLPLPAAAHLQDDLMAVRHDLDRLQSLLSNACDALLGHFQAARSALQRGPSPGNGAAADALRELGAAVTALQFGDLSSQLLAHTHQRLRSCTDRLAAAAMGDDDDGAALVEPPPSRPNPVTQDEMDAGSVELF